MNAMCATLDGSGYIGMPGSCGVSDVHERVNDMFRKAATHAYSAYSLGLRQNILPALENIWDECSVQGWNGYNAAPVTVAAMQDAFSYCEQLSTRRIPDVYADPRGGIIFEWRNDPDSFFLLNFSGNGAIAYASVFGNEEIHGSSKAVRIIPENIRDIVATHFS